MKQRSTHVVLFINNCSRSTCYSLVFLVCILCSISINASAQKNKESVRIENGMMIIRFDKRDSEEFKKMLQHFGLKEDSVWKFKNIGALSKDGWKLHHLDQNIAEIEKPIDNSSSIHLGLPISVGHKEVRDMAGYPAPVAYGANGFKTAPTVFEDKKDITVFLLRGNAKASKVFLSGNFNNWSTMATPMHRTDSGWIATLKLKPGKYLYKFIVDGQWMFDGANNYHEPDGMGSYNSVYFHYNYVFRLPGYETAKKIIVAGSFNQWNEKELVMQRTTNGWQLPLFLSEGTHAYKFIVDKQWILDPSNKLTRPDGNGNFNSYMSVGDTVYFNLPGHMNAKNVFLSGSFNSWNTGELIMIRTQTGWQIPYVLAPGNYEYKFIVDGTWIQDPENPLTVGSGDFINSVRIIKPNYTFVLNKYPDAKAVLLSGSFNNWAEPGYTMQKKDGKWMFPIYLPSGKYTYKFVVDGNWIIDPNNKLYEENEYGTGNSVLWMEPLVTDFDR